MSDTDKLRQKILASFLTVMMIVAIGAEIRAFDQSRQSLNAASGGDGVDIETATASLPNSRQRSFRDQFAFLNSADLVASRFYAPIHAPVSWTR